MEQGRPLRCDGRCVVEFGKHMDLRRFMIYRRTATRCVGLMAALWGFAAHVGGAVEVNGPSAADGVFFVEKIQPLLQESCLKCHGGEAKLRGGLRLTTRDNLLKGGDTGPAISADEPEKSLLLDAVNYRGDLQMPKKQKLPQEKLELLATWAKRGFPWPKGVDLTPSGVAVADQVTSGPPKVDDQARKFWSFQPVRRPTIPVVKQTEWCRSPIDSFILEKLEARKFAPAPAADKITLLRRATYDLTGLPPTPAEIDGFLADSSERAYEKVVDRLLDSPHYGEKWGRHWLDLVRFAETNSYERDSAKPNAWRYRDYVIRSFNADKPYDRFVKEQLAGDELPRSLDDFDPIIATGYYRLGIWDEEPADRPQARYENLDDIVATTGQVFLGLTVDCARCHDHKIDPVPQTDYYRLLSFFQNINTYHNGGPTDLVPILTTASDKEAYEQRTRTREAQLHQTEAAIAELERDFRQLLAGQSGKDLVPTADVPKLIQEEGKTVLGPDRFSQYKQLKKERDALSRPDGSVEKALCVTEAGPTAPDTFVLARGSASAPGQKVEPGFLRVISTGDPEIPPPAPGATTCGRRTVLANWVASKENPLTARVIANRLWQYHFGRGIVRSSSNFGYQGDKPTHPQLLDWLAAELVEGGWKLKPLHRLIMTSSAYRMAATGDASTRAAASAADPLNDSFWHFDLRRLTAEEMRDSILAVNGTLNTKMFGPGIYPTIPREILAGQSRPGEGWGVSGPEEQSRRSVYIHVKRSLRVPIIESLDGGESDKSCPVRFVTIQPTQALGMMNGSFLNGEAAKLAERLRREAGGETRTQVAAALRLVTCRPPTDTQIERGVGLIRSLKEKDGLSDEAALKDFCLVALNLNEFAYVD